MALGGILNRETIQGIIVIAIILFVFSGKFFRLVQRELRKHV